MYHRFCDHESQTPSAVSAGALARQIEYARRHHPIVDCNQQFDDEDDTPGCAVVFTVDDGYRDFFTTAFPVFRSADVPVTVFVAAGFVDGAYWFWWDRLRYLTENRENRQGTLSLPNADPAIDVDLTKDDAEVWDAVSDFLVALPPADIEAALDDISIQLGLPVPRDPPAAYRPFSWDEARAMQEVGISFGAHTVGHPVLAKLPAAEVEEEIAGSKAALNREIGSTSHVFCFPHGQPTDYSPTVERIVEACGFSGCYAAHPKLHDRDRYSSPRYGVSDDIVDFRWKLCGAERLYARLSSSLRGKPATPSHGAAPLGDLPGN